MTERSLAVTVSDCGDAGFLSQVIAVGKHLYAAEDTVSRVWYLTTDSQVFTPQNVKHRRRAAESESESESESVGVGSFGRSRSWSRSRQNFTDSDSG